MSQGKGKPEERERDGRTACRLDQSEHKQHLSIKFVILYGPCSWCPKIINNSNIKDHYNKYNNNEKVGNIMRIMKL